MWQIRSTIGGLTWNKLIGCLLHLLQSMAITTTVEANQVILNSSDLPPTNTKPELWQQGFGEIHFHTQPRNTFYRFFPTNTNRIVATIAPGNNLPLQAVVLFATIDPIEERKVLSRPVSVFQVYRVYQLVYFYKL